MAAKAPYDYIDVAVPDVDITLGVAPYDIQPQGEIRIKGWKNQEIHKGYDRSEERISLGDDVSEFVMTYPYEFLTASEVGILFDLYYDETKGNGIVSSFKIYSIDGPHTYVVRFDCDLEQVRKAYDIYGVADIDFAILGKILDV